MHETPKFVVFTVDQFENVKESLEKVVRTHYDLWRKGQIPNEISLNFLDQIEKVVSCLQQGKVDGSVFPIRVWADEKPVP